MTSNEAARVTIVAERATAEVCIAHAQQQFPQIQHWLVPCPTTKEVS